ncbi:pentapeptide repeat-containing protein [uncultured Tenacibaculum sp.]|uniref:pentapeptide repeat-containing protein n=1 Tax=uncultured Tenacibaculum sp. TaxID=174713 RepID=UPI00261231BC|nr:pentapeptide repeat-containing protein [uncultured Tenacibaculum sp.]
MNDYYDNEEFVKTNFTNEKISRSDFDSCTFKNCDFTDMHIVGSEFLECEFIDCNFSNTRLRETSFKTCHFYATKLLGVKFYGIDPFLLQMNFTGCQLDYSSFYQLKMQNFQFVNCSVKEVDFTDADLQFSYFDDCDLLGTIFENTDLRNTNFKTARNFSIDLESNKVEKAIFSKDNVANLLDKYKIKIQ